MRLLLRRMRDEYEITVMVECSGKRFIGNTIENFSEQDLFLIGPHVPHFVQLNDYQREEVIALRFLKEAFGTGFFDLSENEGIARLLHEVQRGVSFDPTKVPTFYRQMAEIVTLQGFERMIALASGYNQLTHFNRQFKRIVGYSPKEYRHQLDRQSA